MEQRRRWDVPDASVGVVGLGAWQPAPTGAQMDGGLSALRPRSRRRTGGGVTLIDTADVYGDGRSEQIIGRFIKAGQPEHGVTVATKMGRRMEQRPGDTTALENFRAWTERSRKQPGRGHP